MTRVLPLAEIETYLADADPDTPIELNAATVRALVEVVQLVRNDHDCEHYRGAPDNLCNVCVAVEPLGVA